MLRSNRCWTKGQAAACFMVWISAGCASTPDTGKFKELPYEQNAIQLQLLADSSLNQFEGEAHTLAICVYQLSESEAFSKMIQTQDGVIRLLNCMPFGDSVTSSKRIIVHPNEKRTVNLDRVNRTEFVGLVSGYYESTPKLTTRLYKIPIQYHEKGFFIWKKKHRLPKKLQLTLQLDSRGLRPDGQKQTKLQVGVPYNTDEPPR